MTVWEVEVVTKDAKFEVEVDAAGGQVVTDRQEQTSDLAKYNRRLDAATLTHAEAIEIVEAFLAEPFSDQERHQRRIDMLTAYENR